MRSKEWTTKEAALLLELRYRLNLPFREVAKRMKRSFRSVRSAAFRFLKRRLIKEGINRKEERKRKASLKEEKYVSLFSEPHTYAMVARIMGISERSARKKKCCLKAKGYQFVPVTRKGTIDPDSDSPYDRSHLPNSEDD